MRINHRVLSIPPYISTSWNNISSLQSKEESDQKHSLLICLKDGSSVLIPEIEPIILHAIFSAHARALELEQKATVETEPKKPARSSPLDYTTKLFEMENMHMMMSHNEQEKNAPDLPPEILKKIEQVSQKMGLSNSSTIPTPEPHCNCPYCQIARAVQKSAESASHPEHGEEEEEEVVSAKDLSFTSWIIQPLGNHLYKVSHPDSQEEVYQVFLGSPIGCTCGSKHCEHIKAVLSS